MMLMASDYYALKHTLDQKWKLWQRWWHIHKCLILFGGAKIIGLNILDGLT
jgi:hypothetical protein